MGLLSPDRQQESEGVAIRLATDHRAIPALPLGGLSATGRRIGRVRAVLPRSAGRSGRSGKSRWPGHLTGDAVRFDLGASAGVPWARGCPPRVPAGKRLEALVHDGMIGSPTGPHRRP
jgi:hypothetical protein